MDLWMLDIAFHLMLHLHVPKHALTANDHVMNNAVCLGRSTRVLTLDCDLAEND